MPEGNGPLTCIVLGGGGNVSNQPLHSDSPRLDAVRRRRSCQGYGWRPLVAPCLPRFRPPSVLNEDLGSEVFSAELPPVYETALMLHPRLRPCHL